MAQTEAKRPVPTDASQMTRLEKLAVLLTVLGTETAAGRSEEHTSELQSR